ncbi:hypothetical protein VCE7224_04497 [Vibrio celticus]|uniref:Uncharacterized protein n=1 Tax=Vibrio celticus TaxID=446372 RepID=A0A1C3JKQ5_9VIBR|nr:hypothetical protein VCE7224_04497 [Vibrio celticus]
MFKDESCIDMLVNFSDAIDYFNSDRGYLRFWIMRTKPEEFIEVLDRVEFSSVLNDFYWAYAGDKAV